MPLLPSPQPKEKKQKPPLEVPFTPVDKSSSLNSMSPPRTEQLLPLKVPFNPLLAKEISNHQEALCVSVWQPSSRRPATSRFSHVTLRALTCTVLLTFPPCRCFLIIRAVSTLHFQLRRKFLNFRVRPGARNESHHNGTRYPPHGGVFFLLATPPLVSPSRRLSFRRHLFSCDWTPTH